MPRGNKKGPMGEGPNTGRGLGYCTGHDEPGGESHPARQGGAGRGMGRGFGRGMAGGGRGQGRGRGTRRFLAANHHDQEELSSLRRRIQDLEARVADKSDES